MRFTAQVLHVLRKDVRRFRWPVLGLFALMMLHVFGLVEGPGSMARFSSAVPFGLVAIALSLLAVLVVHQDNPSDDRAFWTTLPISGGAVSVAKITFVATFLCALPVAVEVVWFQSLNAEAPLATMAGDSALYLGSVLAVAAAAASMTRTLRAFLALVLGVWVGTTVLEIVARQSVVPLDFGLWSSGTLDVERLWVALALGLGLLVHQYTTLHTRRTALSALLGLAALPMLFDGRQPAGGPGLFVATDAPAEATAIDSVAIRLEAIERGTLGLWFRGDTTGFLGTLSVDVSPPGFALLVEGVESRIRGADVDRSFSFLPGARGRNLVRAWNVPMVVGSRLTGSGEAPVVRIGRVPFARGTAAELDTLEAADQLDLDLSLAIYRWEEVGRIPVVPGATLEMPRGTVLRVNDLSRTSRNLIVQLAHRWVPGSMSYRDAVGDALDSDFVVVVHNRTYRELINDTGGSARGSGRTLLGTSHLQEIIRRLEFSARMAEGRDGDLLPEDWFDDVELVVLRRRPAGSLSAAASWTVEEWPGPGGSLRIDEPGDTR